ncbi:putative RNA exonuclease C9B6.11c [Hypsizygus marmoreus]|uniref:RNA exonuclease C9B6.11c n=1 Tax=Hypsizygus marmoreus TaxID=39966 RepID=A0A369K4H2_HYPMA|nr:putative RNA exonuclease C9B6.11c [Hypsizygus marmoreus]
MAMHSPRYFPKPFHPTPEQLALSEARKIKKQKKLESLAQVQEKAGAIIPRSWIPVKSVQEGHQDHHRVRLLTWNLLAQCLIRRKIFPTSNCLKAAQREQMLIHELLAPEVDIMCLQEVDRLEKLLPALEHAGYAHHYAAGPGKQHGCLIAFKENAYSMVTTKLIHYDDEEIRPDGDETARRGRSFQTRNIGSLVALRSTTRESEGVIVATTHLFWHPGYTYERARQIGILVREALRFRSELDLDNWPCVIAGDFNFAPNDPAYSLLVGDPLLPDQEERLLSSYVVHVSVDPSVPETDEDDSDLNSEEAADQDEPITSARPATPADGLLSVPALADFFSRMPKPRSAYDEGLAQIKDVEIPPTYGAKALLAPERRGRYEPEFTSYTHYWKAVLDYIFILDPVDRRSCVVSLLAPHRAADLEPGLPQKGISSSDHISLAVELCWQVSVTP